jgi:predicted membrane protein
MDDKPNVGTGWHRGVYLIRPGRGIFVGVLLLALGVVLLLDQQGVVSAHRMYQFFWPAMLVFYGLENLLGRCGSARLFGGALVAIGVVMLLGDLGYIPFHIGFETIWPILLIALGLALVARRFRDTGPRNSGSRVPFVGRLERDWGVVGGEEADGGSFNYSGFMSGVKQRIVSKNFTRGKVAVMWGGFDIDFTQADIQGESAVIDVTAFMGGGKIRVPSNWIVEMRGTPMMGGLVDERVNVQAPDAGSAKRLIVRGIIFMGGVVIKD